MITSYNFIRAKVYDVIILNTHYGFYVSETVGAYYYLFVHKYLAWNEAIMILKSLS